MAPNAILNLRLYDLIMLQGINAVECLGESQMPVLYNEFDI